MAGVIGKRLRAAREAAGLDQTEVAIALGFRWQAAISNIERGQSSIHVERLAEAARLLRVSADYLLGLGDDPTPAREVSDRPPAPPRGPPPIREREAADTMALMDRATLLRDEKRLAEFLAQVGLDAEALLRDIDLANGRVRQHIGAGCSPGGAFHLRMLARLVGRIHHWSSRHILLEELERIESTRNARETKTKEVRTK